ncbi:MAG: hypothetical protein AWM53_00833 [Candidatus Dichloromethanomonas elyunquensis]|nr:MAG: hypothetical protein AWM53_00833 [Candidatus Dichloromethanomonas elyunquensis]
MREERDELERYLNELMDELSALPGTSVLELGVQRIENIRITLLKAADENSKLIMESAETKIRHLQNQVNNINGQIEDAKTDIQRELNKILKTLGGSANPKADAILTYLNEVEESKTSATQKSQDITERALSREGLETKIDEVRYKYMIDKVAGELLLNNSGEAIIQKDEKITLEHIEKAQREGKLSELIINMIIPGMDLTT